MGVETSGSTARSIADLNARIDRLPVWGLNRGIFFIVGLAYFFAFYDISAIAYSLPALTTQFHLHGAQLAYPVTFNLVGYVIGAYGLGNLADVVGRRRAMLITVVILALGGLLCAFAWNDLSLTVFRFITGLGMGAELSLAATIMTEFSPTKQRGRNMQLNYFWGALGLAVTPFVAVLLLRVSPSDGWRFVFGFGAIVAVMTIFLRNKYLPESPRWLILHGREKEATDLVSGMEETARHVTGSELPPVPEIPAESTFSGFPTLALFRKPYASRMIITLLFWAVWYITVYAYLGYEPTIVIKMGLSTPSGLLFSALADIAIPIGAVVAFFTVETWQRKYLVAAVAFVFTIALAVMALSTGTFMLFIGTFFSSMMIAANSMAYAYTAESFPTRARATATSIGDGIGHIGGAIAPFIVLAALSAWGARGSLWLLSGIVMVSGLIIAIGGIKTKGEALTEIAQ